jgi:hypothetical protein
MMILMLSMQMQQAAQQFLMQQAMFQQQVQLQLSAMDKRTATNEKYLCKIAKLLGKNKKRKRGWTDDEDNDSSDDK